jgi:hypothetical protein
MHRLLLLHKLQSKIILSFDSYHNKMQSNLQSFKIVIILVIIFLAITYFYIIYV